MNSLDAQGRGTRQQSGTLHDVRMEETSRMVSLAGASNFRDLGGYPPLMVASLVGEDCFAATPFMNSPRVMSPSCGKWV
jgi:hypothetical protein